MAIIITVGSGCRAVKTVKSLKCCLKVVGIDRIVAYKLKTVNNQ